MGGKGMLPCSIEDGALALSLLFGGVLAAGGVLASLRILWMSRLPVDPAFQERGPAARFAAGIVFLAASIGVGAVVIGEVIRRCVSR